MPAAVGVVDVNETDNDESEAVEGRDRSGGVKLPHSLTAPCPPLQWPLKIEVGNKFSKRAIRLLQRAEWRLSTKIIFHSMSADFWAGYVSGAIGILVGNPLDIIKTKLQAGPAQTTSNASSIAAPTTSQLPQKPPNHWTSFARGAAAPIIGYGALNALLFVTYNRSLALINSGTLHELPERPPAWSVWAAGALGGLATFFVSAPTELVKCRAQVSQPPRSSLQVVRELWQAGGLRGLYMGGTITSVRDAVGYGFYFWSYELSKRSLAREEDSQNQQALKVLLCGGLAGVVTWASIFPLDVIKTRVQTWDLVSRSASQPLLGESSSAGTKALIKGRPSSFEIAKQAYRTEGRVVFFRGLGVCSVRAFVVNAVQWAVYEWMMKALT